MLNPITTNSITPQFARQLVDNKQANSARINGKLYSVAWKGNSVTLSHTSHDLGDWLRRFFLEGRTESSAERHTKTLNPLIATQHQQKQNALQTAIDKTTTLLGDMSHQLDSPMAEKSLVCSKLVELHAKLKKPIGKEIAQLCLRLDKLGHSQPEKVREEALTCLNARLGTSGPSALKQEVDNFVSISTPLGKIIKNYDTALKRRESKTQDQIRARVENLANHLSSLHTKGDSIGLQQRLEEELELSADLSKLDNFLAESEKIVTKYNQVRSNVSRFNKQVKDRQIIVSWDAWIASCKELDDLVKSGTSTSGAINEKTKKWNDCGALIQTQYLHAVKQQRDAENTIKQQKEHIKEVRKTMNGANGVVGIVPQLVQMESRSGIDTTGLVTRCSQITVQLNRIERSILTVLNDKAFNQQIKIIENDLLEIHKTADVLLLRNQLQLALNAHQKISLTSLKTIQPANAFAQRLSEEYARFLTDLLSPKKAELTEELAQLCVRAMNARNPINSTNEVARIGAAVKSAMLKINALQHNIDVCQEACIALLNSDETTTFNSLIYQQDIRNEVRTFWVNQGVQFAKTLFDNEVSVQKPVTFEEKQKLLAQCEEMLSYYEAEEKTPDSLFVRFGVGDYMALKDALKHPASTLKDIGQFVEELNKKKAVLTSWDEICTAFEKSDPTSDLTTRCGSLFDALKTSIFDKTAKWVKIEHEIGILGPSAKQLPTYKAEIDKKFSLPRK